MAFALWYYPKARAAQRLNYRPLPPQNFRAVQGAIEWVQPIAVTNALNASLSIQNADFRAGDKQGNEYAQCILQAPVLIQPNSTTVMPLLVQIPILSAPATLQRMYQDASADGIVSVKFSGVVKAEWFWFTIEPFVLDVPINFFKR